MRATLLALACLLLACGARSGPPVTSGAPAPDARPKATPEGGWSTTVQADHPSVGTILRMSDGAELDEAALLAAARRHRFVLLGEKHDNPDHHRLQARLLRKLGAPDAPVVSTVVGGEGTEVLEHFVQFIEPKAMWRLSILARPAPGKILALRAFLSLEGKPVSETWIYEYGAGNGSRRQSD